MTLRLLLLGPFGVAGDGAPEAVRGAIPQAILTVLALDPRRVFTTDELVAALWPEPTDSLVSSLRAHISRLRSRGWGAVLSGGRAGYRLDLPDDAVDLVRYRRLVATTGTERLAALAAAEPLWRGAPLASAAEFPFAAAVIAELTEARRRAMLELTAARLESMDAAAAVAGIAPLARDLGDEEVGALYARALDRSGRTADALVAIDERLAALREAGLAPSSALSGLRLEIARQEAPASVPADRRVDRAGIPVPVTRFVGRKAELEAVRRGRAESRLVTLTGPAGVGKTRLAVEVARRAGADEDEIQRLVDLAVVDAPDRVVSAAADAVRATEHTVDAIVAAVAGRRTLMIFDNAEHVLGSTASLCARLLERCEGLSVVVTSRESMRMAGERVVAVDPLAGEGLADAVELFLQRAGESSGIADWSDEQVSAARRVCARLDGLPLAIELAASRLDVLTLDELATSLVETDAAAADSTATGAAATAGGRHDSIDDAIAWSVRTTSRAERALLAQLVEFSGSFSLEAVAGICTAPSGDARELTVALARRSLVAVVGPSPGERRFRVLDTVKRYMKAQHPIDDRIAWQRRHAAFLTEHAERTAPLLRTRDTKRARTALAANRADLDDACRRLLAWGDRDTAVRLVAALAWYWYERGSGHEAVGVIEKVLALPGDPAPDAESPALYAASFMRAVSGDVVATVTTIQRFAEAADAASDPAYAMIAHTLTAALAGHDGAVAVAEAELDTAARSRARVAPGGEWAIADHLYLRGDVLRILGRPAQALDALEEAFRLADELGHTWTLAATCYITGKVLTQVGRPHDALGMFRTGAQRSVEREDGTSTVAAISGYAIALVGIGEYARAAELFGVVDVLGPRFGIDPVTTDGSYPAPYRERAAHELGADAWAAAREQGLGRDLRWALAQLE